MTPAEAAVLLARISASDNREVSEAAARAWADALPDVELADALEYLPRFYRAATRDTHNWIYPGDVLNGVRELYQERRRAVMEAARRDAIESADPADEEVQEKGADFLATRAAVQAGRQWDAEHDIPGREIDIKAERQSRERAHRNMWGIA